MSTQLAVRDSKAEAMERVVIAGDLGKLSAEERILYYKSVCESVGLNPLTRPFDYITLNGKLCLYSNKNCTEQLRSIHTVSIKIVAREYVEGCYIVTAQATLPNGRTDESIGAVPIDTLKGEARANGCMKSETKAKRRVTLSICGLGMLDETELESIPASRLKAVEVTDKEIPLGAPVAVGSTVNKGPVEAPNNGGSTSAAGPAAQPEIYFEKVKQQVVEKQKQVTPDIEFEGCIDKNRKIAFRNAWFNACPMDMSDDAKEAQRLGWLKGQGFVTTDGRVTSAMIPLGIFEDTKRMAIRAAKALKV